MPKKYNKCLRCGHVWIGHAFGPVGPCETCSCVGFVGHSGICPSSGRRIEQTYYGGVLEQEKPPADGLYDHGVLQTGPRWDA